MSASKRYKTRYPGVAYRLTKNGKRRYVIDYIDSAGKRVFQTVDGNEKDALRQRNQILERMGKGEKVVNSKLTIEDLAEDYLRTQTSHLREKTLEGYEYNLDHWVVPRVGHQKVATFDVGAVAELISTLRSEGFSSWTIRGCLTPLSRMFAYAKRKGWASTNPVMELDKQERPKGDGKQMRILTTDEIQAVLKASNSYRTLFSTAIFSGLRRGELLALRWEHVDLLEGKITVVSSKTEAGVREVVIPDFLVQTLSAYSLETRTEGRVFQYGERNVTRALTAALVKAKVDHVRFHDLRHTFASLLIANGEDVTYVSNQLGHANPAITLKIYAKLFDPEARKKEARKRMQANFAGVAA